MILVLGSFLRFRHVETRRALSVVRERESGASTIRG